MRIPVKLVKREHRYEKFNFYYIFQRRFIGFAVVLFNTLYAFELGIWEPMFIHFESDSGTINSIKIRKENK